ncbi:unnamed protein product [Pleuronectes platessa]|uniref:Heparan-sulfate 6-O-sulfotransferase n=1 Tax=Pleuronectes platessa TaxID=8262 RepID=A0A9N7YJ90_PLEPL|nr:unnamed protein product [Pleuronectes platessa]
MTCKCSPKPSSPVADTSRRRALTFAALCQWKRRHREVGLHGHVLIWLSGVELHRETIGTGRRKRLSCFPGSTTKAPRVHPSISGRPFKPAKMAGHLAALPVITELYRGEQRAVGAERFPCGCVTAICEAPFEADQSDSETHRVLERKEKIYYQRNFYYITMLRDPVSRYLSEWKHEELPACYNGDDWTGVPLADFMNCPSNLANNRQVRMLADLSLVGCYNMSSMSELERGHVLLASAKANLRNMAFYGLTEFQRKTQYLFERTFGLRFIQAFTQINSTRAASVGISEKVRWRIEGLNALDMELYEYAKELFLRRYQYNRQRQHQEERLRRRQERHHRQKLHRTYLTELWRLGGGGEEEDEEQDVVKVLGNEATTEDYSSQVVQW